MFMQIFASVLVVLNVIAAVFTSDEQKETNYLLWAILIAFPLYLGAYK